MAGSVSTEPLSGSLRLHGVLERSWEAAGLSVLWVLGCLPLVTAGSSTVALFEVVAQRQRGDHRPVARAFWAAFSRAPLPRAGLTVVTLLALIGAAQTLAVGTRLADPVPATALQAVGLSGLAAVGGAVVTALPTRAERGESLLATLRLAGAVGLARPLTTLVAVLLTVAVGAAAVLVPPLLLVLGWCWARLLTALARSAWRRPGRAAR